MKTQRVLLSVTGLVVVGGLATAAWFSRDQLNRWMTPRALVATTAERPTPVAEAKVLKLIPQARKNLSLVAKAAKPQTYWRTIQVPGAIVEAGQVPVGAFAFKNGSHRRSLASERRKKLRC